MEAHGPIKALLESAICWTGDCGALLRGIQSNFFFFSSASQQQQMARNRLQKVGEFFLFCFMNNVVSLCVHVVTVVHIASLITVSSSLTV